MQDNHPAQANVFLTDEIQIHYWEPDGEDCERYEYTVDKDSFIFHLTESPNCINAKLRKLIGKAEQMSIGELQETFREQWDKWFDSGNDKEIFNIPMMNALRYYPHYVEFTGEEETSSMTCLVYDRELESWAVGMTGGGMNLSPHLLETFVNLGKGVPLELADCISRDYNAYVSKEVHLRNCDLLAKAYKEYSTRMSQRGKELSTIF